MALRFSAPAGGRPSPRLSEVPVLSPSEKPPPADVASKPAGVGPNGPAQCEDPASESMGSLGTRFAKQGDVNHVCKALEATAGDVWLVDSGATCHIVSTQHLSGFRVVKKHERTANLFNASGGSIVVSGVVDLEVHFGDVFLRLEEVLVAEVGFNVISPWGIEDYCWDQLLQLDWKSRMDPVPQTKKRHGNTWRLRSLRVQRLLDKKRAKNRVVDAMTAIWLQRPKAAAAKPRPVQPRTPTTPAEESSDSSSEGVSEVSGESQLEGEGVAESIGILRSLGTETLWQPGVITRVFGTPALPARLYPEVGAAAALGEKSAGDASSSNPAAGIAAGAPAMAPPTPAATPGMVPPTPAGTEPKSPASLASVIHRPGMLVAKTLLASDGSTVPLPPGVPPRHALPRPPPPPSKSPSAQPSQSFGAIKRANATGKGVYSPLAFGRSIFRAFGRHRFRNRNPIRRLRGRGRGRESGHGARQSRLVNSFDVCFLKKKRTLGEHVWHEGFEWHVFGMELGMNVSLICACFGSLGNPEAPQSLQALTLFPSLLCLPSSRVRTPAMFIDVVAATLFAGLLFAWSLLSGIAFWWCSLGLQLFRKLLQRRDLRTKRFRAKGRRKRVVLG